MFFADGEGGHGSCPGGALAGCLANVYAETATFIKYEGTPPGYEAPRRLYDTTPAPPAPPGGSGVGAGIPVMVSAGWLARARAVCHAHWHAPSGIRRVPAVPPANPRAGAWRVRLCCALYLELQRHIANSCMRAPIFTGAMRGLRCWHQQHPCRIRLLRSRRTTTVCLCDYPSSPNHRKL